MIKKIVLPFCFLFSLASLAQEGTSSPYSFYSIGDVKFKGTADNRAMGGLTIFQDSIHVNFQNPASYAALKLTSLSVGGSYLTTTLKTTTKEESARRSALDYLAVGIPMGKFGAGFGLVPYSAVGYKIQNLVTGPIQSINTSTGKGGLNKAFLGLGYAISSKFSIGADLSYDFGKIETSSLGFIDGVQYGTREQNQSDMTGVTLNTGLMYQSKISQKLSIFSSLTFSPETQLKSSNGRTIASIQYSTTGAEVVVNESIIDVANTTLVLPTKFSFGTGIGEFKKWMIGAEVTFQENSKLRNRFDDILGSSLHTVKFENAMKYNLGGYYIPNYNSFSNYWNKIVYRGGLRYENTGLVFNQDSIQDMGLTLGLGLPIPGAFSNINIGFEYGKRGTTNGQLVQENYANLSIGLSFNDKWFNKKLYN